MSEGVSSENTPEANRGPEVRRGVSLGLGEGLGGVRPTQPNTLAVAASGIGYYSTRFLLALCQLP